MEFEYNYYKIVETKEMGKSFLSPVPRMWESGGKLMWPPKSKKESAMRKPLVPPGNESDGWTKHDCIVKRTFISTYSEALNEIRRMSDMSDTTDVEPATSFSTPLKSKKRTAGARKILSTVANADGERSNFNEYQEQISNKANKNVPRLSRPILASPVLPPVEISNLQVVFQPEEQQLDKQHVVEIHQQEQQQRKTYVVGENGQLIQIPIEEEVEEGPGMQGMFTSMSGQISRLQARVEHLIRLQEEMMSRTVAGIPANGATEEDIEFEFEAIQNVEQLVKLELNLNNKDFRNNLYKKLCSICCPKSGHSGDNVSYRIVDSVLSRRLFTLVSWSGVSRTKKNENFSRFVNTFKFFHKLVKRCDPSYSETNLKKFFQRIIDNSKRRYESSVKDTPKRISATKHLGNPKKRLRTISTNSTSRSEMDSIAENNGKDDHNSDVDVHSYEYDKRDMSLGAYTFNEVNDQVQPIEAAAAAEKICWVKAEQPGLDETCSRKKEKRSRQNLKNELK